MTPLPGGGIASESASFVCEPFLFLLRVAMSMLASVVSLGSPGSCLSVEGSLTPPSADDSWFTLGAVRVLGLLLGGLVESTEVEAFLCFVPLAAVVVLSSASSPEASRDDGCRSSAVVEFLTDLSVDAARLRFEEPEDDGDDIWASAQGN